jgi:integrase
MKSRSKYSARLNRLGDMTIRNLVKAGPVKPGTDDWHADGGNLYLKTTGAGTASWVFRYSRYMGLGTYPTVSLAKAREKARECRKLLADGIDPLEHREATRQQAELDKAKAVTFGYCAELWLQGKSKICTARTVKNYEGQLRNHVYKTFPTFKNLPIKDIDTALVLQVLEPLWEKMPVTAAKCVRPYLEEIFDLAKARRYRDRDSENPARWTGHIEHTGLAPLAQIHTTTHRKMLPYADLPAFMTALRGYQDGHAATLARCCEFMILTTTRPGEATTARFSEIHFENRVWNIPADKKKERRAHTVPLSDRAMQIALEQREISGTPLRLRTVLGKTVQYILKKHPHLNDERIAAMVGCSDITVWHVKKALRAPREPSQYLFVQKKRGDGHLHRGHLNNVFLPSIGYGHVDAHGFRASFSTWANDERMMVYPRELREFQLAHKVDDDTAGAYQRGTGLALRRRMLQDYADYCYGIVTPKVVPLRGGDSV